MLCGSKDKEKYKDLLCGYGNRDLKSRMPKYKLNDDPVEARLAKRIIEDQLLDEGTSRLNLATLCQTFMEKEAIELMSSTLEKNAIDKSEYPQTAEIENRCVNIIADLWHAPEEEEYIGTSTVGSSEACMLAGMAMKFRWRRQAEKNGIDIKNQKPNLVISSAFQVCWEKFCVYWDIEMRQVPIDADHLSLNTDRVLDYVDEYTIGIVGIMGITYTGKYDDIKALDDIVSEYNSNHRHQLVIHVDGASGGMFAPFADQDLEWDFRLPNVVSISTSGHKYGLVYPGVGWVIWRDREYLPEELIFEVSYLGGSMPTMAINFSRSASQLIGQYYNFVRFGFCGFCEIQDKTREVAVYISGAIEKTGLFEIYNDGSHLPIVCYRLKEGAAYEDGTPVKWNLYDLSDRLKMHGWQIPTYPFPADMEDVVIQRIVCRVDLGYNLAEELIDDFCGCIEELKKAHALCNEEKEGSYGFTH